MSDVAVRAEHVLLEACDVDLLLPEISPEIAVLSFQLPNPQSLTFHDTLHGGEFGLDCRILLRHEGVQEFFLGLDLRLLKSFDVLEARDFGLEFTGFQLLGSETFLEGSCLRLVEKKYI